MGVAFWLGGAMQRAAAAVIGTADFDYLSTEGRAEIP
jgi:hypothetical protein